MDNNEIRTGIDAFNEIKALYADARTPEDTEKARSRQKEIQEALQPEELKALNSAIIDDVHAKMTQLDDWIDQAEDENMREKLGTLPEAVSMSYIAKTYFGKSRSWLLQRINGNKVNGKIAKFSREERLQLENALHDLGKKLSSVALV